MAKCHFACKSEEQAKRHFATQLIQIVRRHFDVAGLVEVLKKIEVKLHQLETRRDPTRMRELLHPEFVEFGRSGKIYSRDDVLAEFSKRTEYPTVEAKDFLAIPLAENVALLTYTSTHIDQSGNSDRRTLRSSIWVRGSEGWRMRFHQGTPADAES